MARKTYNITIQVSKNSLSKEVTYKVLQVTNSIDFLPGEILKEATVEGLCRGDR